MTSKFKAGKPIHFCIHAMGGSTRKCRRKHGVAGGVSGKLVVTSIDLDAGTITVEALP